MSRPLRALLATNVDRGGAAILLARVARHLGAAGVEPLLYLPKRGFIAELVGDRAEVIVEPDFVVPPNQREFGWRRLIEVARTRGEVAARWARAAARFPGLVRRRGVDVVSAFGIEPQVFSALAGQLSGTPVVWNALQTFDDRIDPVPIQLAGLLPSVRAIVAVSEAAAAPFRLLGKKTRVIFNGVDPGEFDRAAVKPALRAPFRIPHEAALIGVVGRPSREKGFDIFFRAAARVLAARPEARFVVLGAGVSGRYLGEGDRYAFEAELDRLLDSLGLRGRVLFTGAVEDVRPQLADLDIVAIPSRRDAAPLVAFEAMAMGLPVVGSDVHGIPELVRDGVEGLLVPPGDDEALARAFLRLLDAPAERRRMGEAARRRAVERFDLRKNVAEMAALYREVAASRPLWGESSGA